MKTRLFIGTLLLAWLALCQSSKPKISDQGYIPDGWYPHEGGLLKYQVHIRFGEELVGAKQTSRAHGTMPAGWKFGRVSSVSTNQAGTEVYVFQRGPEADPLIVFDNKGKYLRSWGKGLFGTPHGLRLDKDDNVFVTDSRNHVVMKFDKNGNLLMTLGIKGQAGTDDKTFNRPTDIAFAHVGDNYNGDFYISDGYGNSRVVKFNAQGRYLLSWGKPGNGPGEFHVPHAIAVDSKGRVYVSDRENNRIQIFSANGEYLRQWNNLGCTQGMFMTPDDKLWIITHRNNIENGTYDALAGRLMQVDIETGKVSGAIECPGHELSVASDGQIYVASLTGNVFQWYPAVGDGWRSHIEEDAK
jgi:DNA-binding beta-propeller fold protein YncE